MGTISNSAEKLYPRLWNNFDTLQNFIANRDCKPDILPDGEMSGLSF
jgi:hypothetical protein